MPRLSYLNILSYFEEVLRKNSFSKITINFHIKYVKYAGQSSRKKSVLRSIFTKSQHAILNAQRDRLN